MAISGRERRLIAAAALLALALLLYLLLRGDGGGPAPVELVAQPVPRASAPPPPATAPPAPAPDASALRLHGLLASGAIIGFADGSQRLVRIGREALPGLTLARIEQRHAVLASAAGELRLGFDGAASAQAAPQAAAPAASSPAAERDETLRYRLGLEPRRADGRITGFTVRPGADLPALQRAGIRPGDTIVSVNGSVMDEERMQELAWTIANSSRTEIEVERGGRRLRTSIPGR